MVHCLGVTLGPGAAATERAGPRRTQFAFQCRRRAGQRPGMCILQRASLQRPLSSSNEGKQSSIMTLGMVVVFKLGRPGDLRLVTRLHRAVRAKKIPGDEN